MRKFLAAIKKNFKILFRLKTSMIAMILGPLLVIFLIGFAFNSSSQFQISIGYAAQDDSNLTSEFVDALSTQYAVKGFTVLDDCIWELKQSIQHVCIEFPAEFEIRPDHTNNITFYVDKSRVNIVYAVLSSVEDQIGVQSDQLSKGLTQALVDTLEASSENIDSNLGNLILIKKAVGVSASDVEVANARLAQMDFSYTQPDADFSQEVEDLQSQANTLRTSARSTIIEGLELIEQAHNASNPSSTTQSLNELESELEDLNTTLTEEYTTLTEEVDALQDAIANTVNAVDTIVAKLDDADTEVQQTRNDLLAIITGLSELEEDVEAVKQNLERASQRISQVEITSSDQIVNPIKTSIQTVASDNNQMLVLFPYVLMLIIMFGGLMLASTLIVVEKRSKAYFRVFTTPTRNQFYIWTSFVTVFIILLLQILIIYALMKLFFIDLIGSQLLVNGALLLIAMSLFIMMGMAIGYLMRNQQGANMMSISLGALFLFLSNIVLPLETVSEYLQEAAQFNPFVMTSEVLRRSIVFQTPIEELYIPLAFLLAYTIAIFIIITVAHGLSKTRFVHRLTKRKKHVPQVTGVMIGNQHIESERDLVRYVQELSDKEFHQMIKKNRGVRRFIRDEMSDGIGRRVHKLSKAEFLDAVADHNEKLLASLEKKVQDRGKQ